MVSITVFGALLVVFLLLVGAGERGGSGFFDNAWLTVPALIAYGAAVVGSVLGVVAIAIRRERSVFVVAATVVALLVTAFGVLEVAFPH